MSHGSMTLPSDLLIFLPSASRMCPRTRHVLNEVLPKSIVEIGVKGVEPAARLVDGLADVVGGEVPLEVLRLPAA